ncbi:MAG: aminotransferase class I/II-fold pyridoxal phosphate-dependent enzyme, partial [Actinobacteria bacterium]|nr:aminotransferase class I/II-fold pyridoxal phosphate-dependent enzyme [Actinomycetota bacterium]NDE84025.1 aminotransferase class I/II-fold pyridoxal phosphate-dependent enzyme [Actinomycetota bacterium]
MSGEHIERFRTHEPENLQERFAHRAAHMKPSEIRSLFAVASRPEIVSLAGGMPNLTAIDMNVMASIVERLVREHGQEALQYGSGQGHPKLREQICDVMALEGIRANPDDVLVTTGSQQALDLISRIFIDPGDVVLVEAPSYV